VTYTDLKTTRYRFNLGPDVYETGIGTINPPLITPPYEDIPANGPIYPSFIPKTDSDGNDIAGVRLGRRDRASRHVHRLGAAIRRLGGRRV
jgi:hypothetical protein